MSIGKSELCIFNRAPPQVVVENYSFETIYPVNSIDNQGVIEFHILSSDSHYLDLNDTLIYVVGTVTKPDGTTKLIATDNIVPINYFLQNMFKDIQLTLNNTLIEGGNNLYAQKANIEAILNYNQDTENIFGISMGCGDDDTRKTWVLDKKKLYLTGSLHLDFFDQPKYLIPGVNILLKMKINDDKYLFTGGDAKLKLDEMKLLVRRVKVAPSVLSGHQVGLNTQNAVYPIRKTRILTFSLARGNLNFYKDQIFGDTTLPKFLLITFQETEKLNGSKTLDSGQYKHVDVSRISLSRNTDYRDVYELDWTGNAAILAYTQSIIRNMGFLGKNTNNGITYEEFTKIYPFFTFVLAPDFDLSQVQMPKQGNLKLDIQFKSALEQPTSVIIYGVFDSEVQISKSRAIFM